MLRRLVLLLAAAAIAAAVAAPPAGAFGPLLSFGERGIEAGQLSAVGGIAIGPDGSVYVADALSDRIDVFAPDGTFRFAFGKEVNPDGSDTCTTASGCRPGNSAESAGGLADPAGMDFSPDGNLYVADAENERVDVFASDGTFLFAFGKGVNADGSGVCVAGEACRQGTKGGQAGAMSNPVGVGIDPAGDVYVADLSNDRIDVFDQAGAFLRAFGNEVNLEPNPDDPDVCTGAGGCRAGSARIAAGAFQRPDDVAVAPSGQVVVADFGNSRIDVFDGGGKFLYTFGKEVAIGGADPDICRQGESCENGSSMPGAGSLPGPAGVAIGADGQVFVADTTADRVDQFGLDGSFVRSFGAGVLDGAGGFEICTLTCRAGIETAEPAGVANPEAIALDDHGAVYANSEGGGFGSGPGFAELIGETSPFVHVERFGEPVAAPPALAPRPPAAPRGRPSNAFKLGKLKLNRRKGTATLAVLVPGPGTVAAAGNGLRSIRTTATAAGRVTLPLRSTGRRARALRQAGAVRLRVKVTYVPSGGDAAGQVKVVRLRRLRRAPG